MSVSCAVPSVATLYVEMGTALCWNKVCRLVMSALGI